MKNVNLLMFLKLMSYTEVSFESRSVSHYFSVANIFLLGIIIKFLKKSVSYRYFFSIRLQYLNVFYSNSKSRVITYKKVLPLFSVAVSNVS